MIINWRISSKNVAEKSRHSQAVCKASNLRINLRDKIDELLDGAREYTLSKKTQLSIPEKMTVNFKLSPDPLKNQTLYSP